MTNYKKCNLYVMSFCALALSSITYASNVVKEERGGFFSSIQQRKFEKNTESEGESETFSRSRFVSKTDEVRKKYPERNYQKAKQSQTGLSRIDELKQALDSLNTENNKLTGKMKEDNDKIDEIASTGLKITTEIAEKIASEKLGSPTLAEIIKKGLTRFSGS